jgi:DNA-binding GntR family transcriptional regulator
MADRPILNVKSLKEQVYDYLRHQLRSGEILPGSAIRDALLQLESEGFVTIYPRRGIIVNTLSLEDIKNYYQIIGALESTALLQASDKIGEDEIRRMEEIIEGMKRAIESDDFDLYYEKNLALHDVYLASCGNGNLVRILKTLKRRLYDFPRQRGFVKEWELASIAEHTELLQLLKQRKAAEAAAYVRDVHWSYRVQERYINQYYKKATSTLPRTER